MIEKIGHIRNPLSIVAIFAGISEISATGVLPFIDPATQRIYIWFLILFPFFLVALFFATLIFKREVLYGPSDYKNEDNFFRRVSPATIGEVIQRQAYEAAEEAKTTSVSAKLRAAAIKLESEVSKSITSSEDAIEPIDEADTEAKKTSETRVFTKDSHQKSTQTDPHEEYYQSILSEYRNIEEKFVNLILSNDESVSRNVVIESEDKRRIFFDAIKFGKGPAEIYEFKYTKYLDKNKLIEYARELNKRIVAAQIPPPITARILIAVENSQDITRGNSLLPRGYVTPGINIKFQIYSVEELLRAGFVGSQHSSEH